MLHVGTGFANACCGLLGDARHEVQIESRAVWMTQRIDDGVFQLLHGVVALAERLAHIVGSQRQSRRRKTIVHERLERALSIVWRVEIKFPAQQIVHALHLT